MYIHTYIYIYISRYIHLQATVSTTDFQKVDWDDLRLHFDGLGLPGVLPASLLWQLECTGVASTSKVGYLALVCSREHRFREI